MGKVTIVQPMPTPEKAKKKVKQTFSGKPSGKAPFHAEMKGKKAKAVKKAEKLIVGEK